MVPELVRRNRVWLARSHPSDFLDDPLDPVAVRILGVLVEKEFTTPDNYPLSVNALTGACNQATNREPVMSLTEEEPLTTPRPPSRVDLLEEEVRTLRAEVEALRGAFQAFREEFR